VTTSPDPVITRNDPVITRNSVLAVVATVVFAGIGYAQATGDWRSQLRGDANPFLGRPSPWLTIGLGLIVSVVVVLLALTIRQALKLSNEGRPRRYPRWWWPLAAWWAAYALGAAVVIVGGGPHAYSGTMRFEFGPPISGVANVAATCRTPVGKPDVVMEVQPALAGLPELALPIDPDGTRHPATDEPVPFRLTSAAADAPRYEPPNLLSRPLPYLLETADDGTTRSDPPIGFLEAYEYRLTRLDDSELTGDADLVGTRWPDPSINSTVRWVNLEMPNDPWPPRIELKVTWSCDRSSG
jgi:hypothetical protein